MLYGFGHGHGQRGLFNKKKQSLFIHLNSELRRCNFLLNCHFSFFFELSYCHHLLIK